MLVPLIEEKIERRQEEKPRVDTRRLALLFCTGTLTGHTRGIFTYHPTDEQWFKDELTPYIDSDIRILSWEAMRGNFCTFHTKIGDVGSPDNTWNLDWVDPLEAVTKIGHENGIAFSPLYA